MTVTLTRYLAWHFVQMHVVMVQRSISSRLPLCSIVIRASTRGVGGRDSIPDHVTKDVKNGRFALLSFALGINALGIQLGSSKSV